jgi:trimeric autotransporter adhesin
MKKLTILVLLLPFSFSLLKAQTGIINTIAGNAGHGYNGDNIQATTATLYTNNGVAIDETGNIYIADSQNNRIRKVATTGVITTIGGNGAAGYSGNGGQATAAEINTPWCVRADTLGNIYFSDQGNNVIRKITAAGIISTIAGNGRRGYSGDGGQATAAELRTPYGIGLDKNLNLYIADGANNVIRKVTYSTGVITTVAGNNHAGFTGNGGQATVAELSGPEGVAADQSGDIYIADFNNSEVRKVSSAGIITDYAGNGIANFNGDAGLADTMNLYFPANVTISPAGNIYIADEGDGVVREVMVATNMMYVIAGDVNDGFSGDGGPAVNAQLNQPTDMMTDKNNNVYIADQANNRVRKITAGCAGDTVRTAAFNYPECNGFHDGIAASFPSSPFEPYTYLWSPGGATTNTVNGLSAGIYTVQVTDALGCVAKGTIDITQPAAIVVTTSNYSVCLGEQVTLSATASDGNAPYTYQWLTGSTNDTSTIRVFRNIEDTIFVNDNTGCFSYAVANITALPIPNVILNAESYSVCVNITVDSLYGIPSGVNSTYSGPDLTGNIFNPNAAGVGTYTFTYKYTDSAGCSNTATQSIIVANCSTGIDALDNGERIAVYPNPASNQFTVQLRSEDAASLIRLYTITGQQVYEHKYTTTENSQLSTINTQALPNGIYFLKVVLNDGNTLVQKVDIAK